MSSVPAAANDKSAWIRDLVYLAFPEGEARERVLFDLVKQFSKMDPEDPEWLRYKLSVVECRALENVSRGLNDAAEEQARLRGVTREITSDFKQCLSAGVKEQVVDEPLVLQGKRGQFPRQSEHGMDVASGQQFPLARFEPAPARVAVASWAMPVSAGVVGYPGRMSAAGAAVAMAAQRGCAAARNGQQHLLVLPVDPPAAVFDKCLSSTANNIGHLHERPVVQLCFWPP
jgi:hypothetical protein